MEGHIAHMENTNVHIILVGKPERKRTRGRPRCTRENNIKIYFKKQNGSRRTGVIWLKIEASG
jgi:hypothetical protein